MIIGETQIEEPKYVAPQAHFIGRGLVINENDYRRGKWHDDDDED